MEMAYINKELLKLIENHKEIENSLVDINPIICNTFQEIYTACCESKITETDVVKIDSVVDYLNEELHTGHWNLVPLSMRKSFYAASFMKAVVFLSINTTTEALHEVLKIIDMGILLGAPLDKNDNLLPNCAKCINSQIASISDITNFGECSQNNNKRKLENFPEFHEIKAAEIDSKILPSLEHFLKNYFLPQLPLKIQDSMNHWPACHKWNDLKYLVNIAGERTVPIEIGSQYADQNWSQKLMTFKKFIENYYLGKCAETGYLAQHNLFDQIPELKDDICIPEYCSLNRDLQNDSTLEINAWLGPNGTISSMHYDPKDNLLSQIYGTKLIIMFSPCDTEYLYPHEDVMLCNTSQINPLKPNIELFPKFSNAKMLKGFLKPGEILYIPPKWWHYVIALENSFSVNFWWT